MRDRIRLIRKQNKLTQEKFAERLKLSRNFVNQMECGKKSVSDRTIKDICREFNINEDWLRTGQGEMISDTDIDYASVVAEIGVTDERAKEIIIKYFQLNDKDKKLLWDFIQRFIKK